MVPGTRCCSVGLLTVSLCLGGVTLAKYLSYLSVGPTFLTTGAAGGLAGFNGHWVISGGWISMGNGIEDCAGVIRNHSIFTERSAWYTYGIYYTNMNYTILYN